MTIKYNNVYINETATVAGLYEKKGPLNNYFDKSYDDFYIGISSFEQAESKLIENSVNIILNKIVKTRFDIYTFLSVYLFSQLGALNYAASNLCFPLIG